MNLLTLIYELAFPYRIEWARGPRMIKVVFVFGSNLAGIHGAGAALHAKRFYGAVYGQGQGHKGNSYAIPTKDDDIKTLPLKAVKNFVDRFLVYARKRPNEVFLVTAIGCGLAGFTHEQMAPLFADASSNCWFDLLWKPILGDSKQYWGTWTANGYVYTPEYTAATTAVSV